MAKKDYVEILGEKEVVQNIEQVLKRMKLKSPAALLAGAWYTLEKAEDTVPRNTGFLAGSAFAETEPTIDGMTSVIFGYKKEYAAYVHEMPDSTNFQKPQAESQWLLKTLQREQQNILKAIRDQAREDLNNPFNKRGA